MKKIGMFGPPRSGTSWLAHIFNSHPFVALRFQPLFSYGHKGSLSPSSDLNEIQRFFSDIERSSDKYVLMRTDSQKNYPVFFKEKAPTHLVFKETRYLNIMRNLLETDSDVLLVGIIRNPLATLASWVRAPKEFSPSWVFAEEWRYASKKNQGQEEEYFGFEKWKIAAEEFVSFESDYPDRFRLIKYEDLRANTFSVVSQLFEFCGLSVNDATHAFITNSKSHHDEDPYSVYRAGVNDDKWKSILPQSIVDQVISELEGTDLERFLEV